LETTPAQLETLFDRLWPICRSILGPGYRESLDILAEHVPFERLRFGTGEKVLDWTVPKEWRIRDAYLVGPDGKRRAEFKRNNLHVLNYSVPFRGKLPLAELKKHLHTEPSLPDAIPYVTSYYKERWGFCMSQRELDSLPDGDYEVVVDSELVDGELVIGEAVLPGETKEEVFFSSYLCHPSLANNELSGPLALVALYRSLAARKSHRYTYRFILSAETIGTIAYLSKRGDTLKERAVAGFQMTCVGDPGAFTYKRSRRESSLADRAARIVLRDSGLPHSSVRFDPGDGSDERQYCSPGYDLPCGSLMRTMYGHYREYHTSLDDKSFISFASLAETVAIYEKVVDAIEANRVYRTLSPKGEPQLGKRGLYPQLSHGGLEYGVKALLWLLNYADGTRDLLEIADLSGFRIAELDAAAKRARDQGLLSE
jgi:aminopeptidase-like protein